MTTTLPRIKVSENQRFLVTEQNEPFFWLGDTAWELFHRLTREEAEIYLENRRQKQFNVIQAVALGELDGLQTPNAYNEIPLFDNDPTRPNEAYFAHVDYIIRLAHQKGLYIGLLPTWADKVLPAWANTNVIFNEENAYIYGRYLGERYKDDTNVIWVLGGDRECKDHIPLWRNMAKGIEEGTDGIALKTFHPWGGHSSSEYLHAETWLDFNMMQSGHHRVDLPTAEMITHDYQLQPTKPVLDGEPNYEDHPINWNPHNGYFTDYEVRKQAYRALFAGAFGHTYGHQSIWQMYDEGRQPVGFALARLYWHKAIDRPGAFQMTHARNLLLSRPFLSRIPDQSLVTSEIGEKAEHIRATRDANGSYAFVYVPTTNRTVTIDTSKLSGDTLQAWWFDPRTGHGISIGEVANTGQQSFTSFAVGPDWILVLDDKAAGFGEPGQ